MMLWFARSSCQATGQLTTDSCVFFSRCYPLPLRILDGWGGLSMETFSNFRCSLLSPPLQMVCLFWVMIVHSYFEHSQCDGWVVCVNMNCLETRHWWQRCWWFGRLLCGHPQAIIGFGAGAGPGTPWLVELCFWNGTRFAWIKCLRGLSINPGHPCVAKLCSTQGRGLGWHVKWFLVNPNPENPLWLFCLSKRG